MVISLLFSFLLSVCVCFPVPCELALHAAFLAHNLCFCNLSPSMIPCADPAMLDRLTCMGIEEVEQLRAEDEVRKVRETELG